MPRKNVPSKGSVKEDQAEVEVEGRVVQLGARLSAILHRELVDSAKARGVSAKVLVVAALEDYLPRLVPGAELVRAREK